MGEAVVPSDSSFDACYRLTYGDVSSIDSPSWIEVHIKRSKCDQFNCGVTLSVGGTGMDICPVVVMLGYMVQWGSSHDPLFLFSDGHL